MTAAAAPLDPRPTDAIAVRRATAADVSALEGLIARSAAGLNGERYTAEQLAAALAHVFGVDSALVADGTYYVAERDGALAGCGGWSRRRTLFGGDRFAARDDSALDPATEPARIRAFFTDPAHARRGVAAALLARCEADARAAGFDRLELMATLPGVPFYEAAGFVADAAVTHDAGGVAVPFIPMTKRLPAPTGPRPAALTQAAELGEAMP